MCINVWGKHIDYPKHIVSTSGDVVHIRTTYKPLKGACKGYRQVNIWNEQKGKESTAVVHRFVAKAFKLLTKELPEVDHLDGIRSNNSLWNLRAANR